MPFMLLILAFLVCAVVWGFFHSMPQGVPRTRLGLCNATVVLLALAVGAAIGHGLYVDAVVVRAGERGLATYLAIMAAGTAFLIVVAAGGMVRNLVLFPLSKRSSAVPPPAAGR